MWGCDGRLNNPGVLPNTRKLVHSPNCHENASTLGEKEKARVSRASLFPFACRTQMCQRAGAGAEGNLCANRRQSEKGRDREATNHSKDKQQRNQCAGTKETFEMLY